MASSTFSTTPLHGEVSKSRWTVLRTQIKRFKNTADYYKQHSHWCPHCAGYESCAVQQLFAYSYQDALRIRRVTQDSHTDHLTVFKIGGDANRSLWCWGGQAREGRCIRPWERDQGTSIAETQARR